MCTSRIYESSRERWNLFIYGENRTSSGSVFVGVVHRIVLSKYTNIRSERAFRPILGPPTFRFDSRRPLHHFRRDCRKDHDKVISYFRVSLRSSNTRTFGNWRTVENVSTTYLFAKLLELCVITLRVTSENCKQYCPPLNLHWNLASLFLSKK